MSDHPTRPFSFEGWIEKNAHLLKPPVGNKLLFENTGLVVQVIGGPNQRVDFHDDPAEEFFYQLRGDMVLKLADRGQIVDVPIREGEVFLIAPHQRHSPQRPHPRRAPERRRGSLRRTVRGKPESQQTAWTSKTLPVAGSSTIENSSHCQYSCERLSVASR